MKTDIRLIALDLDGTLLDSQKRLSARNEKVLRECIARGIYVVPCTGRIWSGVPEFLGRKIFTRAFYLFHLLSVYFICSL